MYILFIIAIWTIKPTMIDIFKHVIQSLCNTCLLDVISYTSSNRRPLKYSRSIRKNDHERPTNLRPKCNPKLKDCICFGLDLDPINANCQSYLWQSVPNS